MFFEARLSHETLRFTSNLFGRFHIIVQNVRQYTSVICMRPNGVVRRSRRPRRSNATLFYHASKSHHAKPGSPQTGSRLYYNIYPTCTQGEKG